MNGLFKPNAYVVLVEELEKLKTFYRPTIQFSVYNKTHNSILSSNYGIGIKPSTDYYYYKKKTKLISHIKKLAMFEGKKV